MRLYLILLSSIVFFCSACKDKDASTDSPTPCGEEAQLNIENRLFHMGFTTWPYGSDQADVDDTYAFIAANADIYSHHLDNKIPWQAWRRSSALPTEFVNDIQFRKDKSIAGHKRLVLVGIPRL